MDDVHKFIKREADQARIHIELVNNHEGPDHVIDTTIERGRVVYAVNGETRNKADVQSLVHELGIQVENICMFLPQDVVRQFPLMTTQAGNRDRRHASYGLYILEVFIFYLSVFRSIYGRCSNQERLENTVNAVGESSLVHLLEKLREIQKRLEKAEDDINRKETNKNTLEEKLRKIQEKKFKLDDVEQMLSLIHI